MPSNGTGMRRCCDSVAEAGRAHIKGCIHYRERRKVHFIRMDDSVHTIKLDRGLYNWLTERKLRLVGSEGVNGIADAETIVECDGERAGVVLTVEYSEAA